MFDIETELKKLPASPGVYMHKDSLGEVIYVGKAVNLRNRVRSYFRDRSGKDPKVRAMVSNIAEFDYIKCATEMEALILECNLIKKFMPKYNILLKDDKTYPYIEVTVSEEYPRVIKTRRKRRDDNRYFGPYSDAGAVSEMVRMLGDMYKLKRCKSLRFPENARPCLNFHIGKCSGICTGNVDREEYSAMIGEVIEILEGKDASLIRRITEKMKTASDELKYEEAAKYRDYIAAIKALSETQRATMVRDRDEDILIPLVTLQSKIVVQYKVRDGKLIGRDVIHLDDFGGLDDSDIIPSFIKQFYTDNAKLPREIILAEHIKDEELLMELLDKTNAENAAAKSDLPHKTRLLVPERGEKKAVLGLAKADSAELLKSLDERTEREKERKKALRNRIEKLVEEASVADGIVPCLIEEGDDREYRIEAYDISNTNGLDTVGAMVVFEGKKAIKKDYRKFRIRTAEGDDYGSLQEVIYRRLKRAENGDEGFKVYPDILFIDGGLGQVNAVKTVVDAFNVPIPVVGLAKDDAHRTRATVFSDGHETNLKGDRLLFSYAGMIQEEVHRFAITFHKETRGKHLTKSALEEIPSIGPTRRKALLRHFKGIDAIRSASYEDLLAVDGMNSKSAENVIDFFNNRKNRVDQDEFDD